MLHRIATWGLVVAIVLVLLDCIGPRLALGAISEVMLLGWLRVLERATPQIQINYVALATGILCIAATLFATHRFGGWLYGEIRARHARTHWPPAWRWQWTLSLVAAVMLMFVAGLVGVGLFRTTSWFLETPKILENGRKSRA